MTNLEKMNQLVNEDASKQTIVNWAYMNRVWLCDLPYHKEFECMKSSVDSFIDAGEYGGDETENWNKFLDAEYVEKTN